MNIIKRSIKKTFELLGFEIRRKNNDILSQLTTYSPEFIIERIGHIKKIHYGCGDNILNEWINVDLYKSKRTTDQIVFDINLLEPHPFPDNWFDYGFSEDFFEHLSQSNQIIFLTEAFRTFRKGGVLRLSFPGLEGVLKRHYNKPNYAIATIGKNEAYTMWGHLHFCSRDELNLICKQIGFNKINFVQYGKSQHPSLRNLDTRKDQIGLNTYVEIIK